MSAAVSIFWHCVHMLLLFPVTWKYYCLSVSLKSAHFNSHKLMACNKLLNPCHYFSKFRLRLQFILTTVQYFYKCILFWNTGVLKQKVVMWHANQDYKAVLRPGYSPLAAMVGTVQGHSWWTFLDPENSTAHCHLHAQASAKTAN
jgi:hypothetical protein